MQFAPLMSRRVVGPPAARGRAQAGLAGAHAAALREAVERRFVDARAVLEANNARAYLARQDAFARIHCAPEMAEFDAMCGSLGLDPAIAFALLHLSILSGRFESDGCTAWARPLAGGGAMLAKNRDLSGPHRHFQEVFLHDDPASPVGPVLCVGTLGAPGVYSSGINARGLAIADTAIQAPRHGVGWLRYLLMTRIAFSCASVEEACDLIAAARHAGGGSLILADARGAVASVELLADGARIAREAPAFRTNHFLCEPTDDVAARLTKTAFSSTMGRYAHLRRRLVQGLGSGGVEEVAAAMADHGGAEGGGFCRHGAGDGSHTVSTSIYLTAQGSLAFARGKPCEAAWERGAIGEGAR